MPSAAEYRKQAEALFRRARETADTEALAYLLRAIEFETMAEALEREQVQQEGTQPPAAPPQQPPAQQPAQQQQQAQPPKKDD